MRKTRLNKPRIIIFLIPCSIFTLKKLQDDQNSLYDSEEEFLQDLLKKRVKHYRQLKYLASQHERTILKLRFVLDPFSFIFLLSGETSFHFVMETLDTEEATYIWHLEKDLKALKQHLITIENDLNLIRNKGRQYFLETSPPNFSRIIHDYSEEQKGFVLWKELLEERLA